MSHSPWSDWPHIWSKQVNIDPVIWATLLCHVSRINSAVQFCRTKNITVVQYTSILLLLTVLDMYRRTQLHMPRLIIIITNVKLYCYLGTATPTHPMELVNYTTKCNNPRHLGNSQVCTRNRSYKPGIKLHLSQQPFNRDMSIWE